MMTSKPDGRPRSQHDARRTATWSFASGYGHHSKNYANFRLAMASTINNTNSSNNNNNNTGSCSESITTGSSLMPKMDHMPQTHTLRRKSWKIKDSIFQISDISEGTRDMTRPQPQQNGFNNKNGARAARQGSTSGQPRFAGLAGAKEFFRTLKDGGRGSVSSSSGGDERFRSTSLIDITELSSSSHDDILSSIIDTGGSGDRDDTLDAVGNPKNSNNPPAAKNSRDITDTGSKKPYTSTASPTKNTISDSTRNMNGTTTISVNSIDPENKNLEKKPLEPKNASIASIVTGSLSGRNPRHYATVKPHLRSSAATYKTDAATSTRTTFSNTSTNSFGNNANVNTSIINNVGTSQVKYGADNKVTNDAQRQSTSVAKDLKTFATPQPRLGNGSPLNTGQDGGRNVHAKNSNPSLMVDGGTKKEPPSTNLSNNLFKATPTTVKTMDSAQKVGTVRPCNDGFQQKKLPKTDTPPHSFCRFAKQNQTVAGGGRRPNYAAKNARNCCRANSISEKRKRLEGTEARTVNNTGTYWCQYHGIYTNHELGCDRFAHLRNSFPYKTINYPLPEGRGQQRSVEFQLPHQSLQSRYPQTLDQTSSFDSYGHSTRATLGASGDRRDRSCCYGEDTSHTNSWLPNDHRRHGWVGPSFNDSDDFRDPFDQPMTDQHSYPDCVRDFRSSPRELFLKSVSTHQGASESDLFRHQRWFSSSMDFLDSNRGNLQYTAVSGPDGGAANRRSARNWAEHQQQQQRHPDVEMQRSLRNLAAEDEWLGRNVLGYTANGGGSTTFVSMASGNMGMIRSEVPTSGSIGETSSTSSFAQPGLLPGTFSMNTTGFGSLGRAHRKAPYESFIRQPPHPLMPTAAEIRKSIRVGKAMRKTSDSSSNISDDSVCHRRWVIGWIIGITAVVIVALAIALFVQVSRDVASSRPSRPVRYYEEETNYGDAEEVQL